MEKPHEKHTLVWQGIEIEVRYWPRYFGEVRAKLDVRSVSPDRAPIPVSLTGYQVCYPAPGEIESIGTGATDQVVAWLNELAELTEWKAHVEASRQGCLF